MSQTESFQTPRRILGLLAIASFMCCLLCGTPAKAQVTANVEPSNARLADKFPSIQAAIEDLPSSGGIVLLSANKTYQVVCGSTQINSGKKVIHIVGRGRNSVISGSGCKLITLSASGSTVEDLTVQDKQGSTATVAIYLSNGLAGMTDWVLKDLTLIGTGKHGIGVGTDFALIGRIRGGEIMGWDKGIQLTGPEMSHRSNANQISGVNIHLNEIGIDIPTGADDNFVESSTIEGNATGIKMSAVKGFAKISISNSHFENNQGPTPANIAVDGVAGAVISTGNGFYAGYPGRDIYIGNGIWNIVSTGDTLNEGVTNGGTGYVSLRCSLALKVLAGNGPIVHECLQGIYGTNLSHNAYAVTGFSQLDLLNLDVSNNNGFMLTHKNAPTPLANFALAQSASGQTTLNGSTVSIGSANMPAALVDSNQNFSIAKKLMMPRCSSAEAPASCGASTSGSIAVPANSMRIVVNTTAVTAESQILVTEDSSLSTSLRVACDSTPGRTYLVTERIPGRSFTLQSSAAPRSGQACLNFEVIN